MASVNISEADFLAVASAAITLWERGDEQEARVLDKLGAKINTALSGQSATVLAGRKFFGSRGGHHVKVEGPLTAYLKARGEKP